MAKVIKKNETEMPEGKRENVKITQFEETIVDENGNLKAAGRKDAMPKTDEKANAKVVEEFDSVEEDENGNLIVHRKPDFAKDKD